MKKTSKSERMESVEGKAKIFPAGPHDAEGITNVLYQAWLQAYPDEETGITRDDIEYSYKEAFTEERMREKRERLSKPLDNLKGIVARVGDTVVGVATMKRNADNNQLQTIYILPEFQGKGIGRLLWDSLKDFRDPKKDTIVHVATYNKKAIGFYKKLGFADTGKRWSDEKWRMKSGNIIPEMEMVIKAK